MRKLIEDGFLHGPRDVRRGTEIRDISLWPELDLDAAVGLKDACKLMPGPSSRRMLNRRPSP